MPTGDVTSGHAPPEAATSQYRTSSIPAAAVAANMTAIIAAAARRTGPYGARVAVAVTDDAPGLAVIIVVAMIITALGAGAGLPPDWLTRT